MRFQSLRTELFFWLLLPLAVLAAADAWFSYGSALETATLAQERLLLGAARMIGQQVQYEDGILQSVVPPAALELFEAPVPDRVFYRVSSATGDLLTGYQTLELPTHPPPSEGASYYNQFHQGVELHTVAFSQPVLAAADQKPVLVLVAQTLNGRNQLANTLWAHTVQRQLALLLLAGVLLGLGLRKALTPLLSLRDQVLQRREGSLERINSHSLPAELTPLVQALNDYVGRLDHHMKAHSAFIANAAHQLRTPLTVLNTQVVYAIRHTEPQTREEVLQATLATVQQATRLVHQLLSFAQAENASAAVRQGPVDLNRTVHSVLESLAVMAAQRQIDLGFEGDTAEAIVWGSSSLLHELVANLVDNALRYTPEGGAVTARVQASQADVTLSLEDDGPGIAVADRERVFERFIRLNNQHSDGCGLGLAIVREIANQHGAQVTLGAPPGRQGLLVTVRFSALPPDQGTVAAARANSSV
jgi:two-component system sensor histidine kinase TctE